MNHDIGHLGTRTLVALIDIHQRTGRATVRDVAEQTGRSLDGTWRQLCKLRDDGLVDMGVKGALRPLVRVVAR